MFGSIGTRGNYANAGRVAANDLVKSFAAARRNSTDFGKIAEGAAAIRSNEKVAAIRRGTEVMKAGINAASDVKSAEQKIEINETIRGGKRKAGALAAAGQLFGNAGQFMGEKRTKREVGSEDSYYDGRIKTLNDKAVDYREQAGEIDTSLPTTTTPTSTSKSTPTATATSISTSTPKTSNTPSKKVTASGDRASNFNSILTLAKNHGGFKFPEVVAAQAMHETGWMNPNIKSVYNSTGGTNPFGQTGDRGYGTIPREGFKDGWTLYPDVATAVNDHYTLWYDTKTHPENYNAFDDRTTGIRTVASAYSPNSDKENIRLGYTENGYFKGVNSALSTMGY